VPQFLGLTGALSVRQTALLVLAATIVALVVLAVAFAVYTIALRIQSVSRARRWERLEAEWEEPLLRALADPAMAPEVHARIEPRYRLHFVQFALSYARRVRGEERLVLRKLAEPYLGPIAARAWSKHQEIRTRAVQTLATLGLPSYAGEVVSALDDPSPLVAMVAARGLATQEHPEYAPAVLRRLERFENWSRSFLASMLSAIGTEGTGALRDTLADESAEGWVRAVSAEALATLKDFESGDLAATVADAEEDPELLVSSLRLLAVVGRPEHAPVVRERCASPDALIRSEALRALGTLGGEEDQVRLLGAMSDPSPWVAIHAAEGLWEAGGIALLRDLAESDHPRAELARQILTEEGRA
jgi:HEAT repeat protein